MASKKPFSSLSSIWNDFVMRDKKKQAVPTFAWGREKKVAWLELITLEKADPR